MRKLVMILTVVLLLFTAGTASALVYENYEGYQYVREGREYVFYFDLVYNNYGYTNSSLTQVNDAAVGVDNLPLTSAFVNVDLYSVDKAWEEATIQLFAFSGANTYTLYDSVFSQSANTDTTLNLSFDISNTSFINDPWGLLGIKAVVNWHNGNWNDFAITQVGIGGETGAAPVPEPATMLLLGTGLIGIAGVGRRRMKK